MMRALLYIIIFFPWVALAAGPYYVSLAGTDSQTNGTIDTPFRSPQWALLVARTNHVNEIIIRGGIYYLTELQIKTNDTNLIIHGYPGEVAILSGGTNISPWVTSVSGTNEECTLPTFPSTITSRSTWMPKRLLVDGVFVPQARLPADESIWWKKVISSVHGTSKIAFRYSAPPDGVPDATVTNNAEFGMRWGWVAERMKGAVDSVNHDVFLDVPTSYSNNYQQCTKYWSNYCVWNTLEGLQTGKWYHDRVNGKIIVTTNNEALDAKVVEIPAARYILNISGTSTSAPVCNVIVSNLTFECAATDFQASGSGGWGDSGAVQIGWASNLLFYDCVFRNVDGHGLRCSNNLEAMNFKVDSCRFTNIGACGLYAYGGTITNCIVNGYGQVGLGGSGIYSRGDNVTVVNCQVYNGPYAGIFFDEQLDKYPFNGRAINCIVSNAMHTLCDGGFLYAKSDRPQFINNRVLGIVTNWPETDDGRWQPYVQRHAIYFDGGTTDGLAVSNVVCNCNWPVMLNADSATLTNNYFVMSTGQVRMGTWTGIAGNVTLRRNIFAYSGVFSTTSTTRVTFSADDLFWSPVTTGIPAAATIANPLFTNNYQLDATSPALALGILPILGIYEPPTTTASVWRANSARIGSIRGK